MTAPAGDVARYAVYLAPSADGLLWQLGSSWLGRDARSGRCFEVSPVPEVSPETWQRLTRDPRRYGFHATLKAPFELNSDSTRCQLLEAVETLAKRHAPFALPRMRVRRLARFLGLVTPAPGASLNELAESCVAMLDQHRAPLTDHDKRRRLAAGLTPVQAELLERWGYPYVLEQFRFHMSLTGALQSSDDDRVLIEALSRYLEPALDEVFLVDSICVFAQSNRHSPFMLIEQFDFEAA